MSTEWNSLAILACGDIEVNNNETKDILNRLGKTISSFSNHLLRLNSTSEEDRLIMPFLSRNILESISAALITRFDPFRVLIIQTVQLSGNYETTSPSNVTLRWSGDIMTSEDSQPNANIWSSKNKLDKFERALFSKHNYELFWKTAYNKFIEYYMSVLGTNDAIQNSEWLSRLTSKSDDVFFQSNKTELMKLFSFFSKGIHHEFIVEPTEIYDAFTVKSKVEILFESISSVLIVSSFINIMNHGLSHDRCLECFLQIERMVASGIQ